MTRGDYFSPEPVEWEKLYRSSRLENNLAKLAQKIFDAEVAMFKRKLQISLNAMGTVEHAEIQAINDALAHLAVRRKDLQKSA